ncbi:hypothetical protein H5410_005460 [Solanum commersonii]|uniref:Protein kinase domain-containing protein n=1 Tax=Solanum commersonii TaxID=4109 RepID=A0A9J6A7C9_SOLCO|nr:hypothetical protein H5410_005460 [Solanum commersonii]
MFVYRTCNSNNQLNMFLSQLFILLLCIQKIIISAANNIHENVAISCGASANSPAPDGRLWIGDSSFTSSFLHITGKSINSRVPHQAALSDPVPYNSARTSRHQFTYQFSMKPGHKFIRLHFKPASYKGFIKSKAIFTVKTDQHTLLSDFIPTLAAGMNYFKKEFCINVKESETLSITFIPSRKSGFSEDTYAFVNAIEIVTMPSGLYFTPDGDQGVPVVGRNYRFYVDNSTALETIQRLNVGGNSISSLEDATIAVDIRYTLSATHIAQKEVYQTARSVGAHCHSNFCNLTWNIPLYLGFRYLVRLQFCEIEPIITYEGQRNFTIVINNQNAEISVYRDYVAIMEGDRREGKRNLTIVLQPHKISNPDNNLGSVRPVHPVTSSTPEKSEESVLFYTKNQIATVLTFIVTLINVAVYYSRCDAEIKSGKTNNGISSGEHQCRQFSLDEMERSMNTFDPQLVIGSGGYGTVYKGDIDGGETTVAVKRSKPGSSQGEKEFWMEISMLSTHRHENLLSLIGYCTEGHEMLLVYDYMPRGSLADNLYKMDRNSSSLLGTETQDCCGVLHAIHRDIKSSNILLDEDWESKISDFGLSKMGPGNESATHVSTQVKGTFGYLDPEYFQINTLTWKTDVYAFGVVLLELLSGRPAVDMRLPEEQHELVAWVKQCIKEGEINKLIDQNLLGSISSTCLKAFIGISAKCFYGRPQERPAMSEVAKSLELALSKVSILGRLSYPNLVKLLGYCQEDKELLLVYEFMPKGSLNNHLFGRLSVALSLPWNVRVQIMIGAARGLAFLHASEKQSYNAKIADFGLAKQGHLYVKSDVYAFGVFLVEMLAGLQVIDSNCPSNQHNLIDWIKPHLSDRRKLKDRIDSRLGGKYPSRAAVQIAQLALSCLGNEPKSRPSMKEIVAKLEQIEVTYERSKDHASPSNPRNRAYPLLRRAE